MPPAKPNETKADELTTKPPEIEAAPVAPPAAVPSPALTPVQILPPIEPPAADLEERAWDELDDDSAGGIDIVGAEPGWRYTTIRPADFPVDGREIHTIRQRMTTRGYEPCNGALYKGKPRREYVPGRPDLEIWRMPQARADNEWRIDMARQVLDKRAAERYWRHNVKGGRKGGLPAKLEEGMLAFHGLLTLPGQRKPPTREQLIAMVRRMPVHPGQEQTIDAW